MDGITRVALIGLGEVGQILAIDLAAAGLTDISAYDTLFADPASEPSQAAVPVRRCGSAAEAIAGRQLVISAVTAASDLDAAKAAAGAIAPGAFFADLNSVSPQQKQAAAAVINAAGGRYVEVAVMSPFAPKRIASAMLLGGPHGEAFAVASKALGFKATVFSAEYGKASAAKMCRSVIIKGLEALVSESLLAARVYGVEADVLASLSDLLPVGDWERLAAYLVSRTLEHGKRRAEEMQEAAATVAEAGVAPVMTEACVIRQAWAAGRAKPDSLNGMLDAMMTQSSE